MVLLVDVQGRTLCVHPGNDRAGMSVGELMARIQMREGIPAVLQRIVCEGRELSAGDVVDSGMASLSMRMRLLGGKGGFGSMLRALGAQRSGAETDNIDSMRDISGRRLRHIQDEKKIAEWLAGQKDVEEEKKRQKEAKREKALLPPKHTFDRHSLHVELEESISGVGKIVQAVLSRKRPAEAGAAAARSGKQPMKRPRIRDEWDSDPSDDDDGAAAAPTAAAKVPAPAPAPAPASAGPAASKAPRGSKGKGKAKATPPASGAAPMSTEPAPSKAPAPAKKGPAPTPTAAKTAVASPPKPEVKPDPLDVTKFDSAEALEELGGDRLKAALMALAAKCSGTVAQRAERLWALKGCTPGTVPAELRAGGKTKKKKGKQRR